MLRLGLVVVLLASMAWAVAQAKNDQDAAQNPAVAMAPAVAPAVATPTLAAAAAPTAALTPDQVLKIGPNDRVMGSMMAPVTVMEYASMTCSHCGEFHRNTLPKFKKEWVDTGKATYVLRDMPWDNLAMGMAKVARCLPREQYFAAADVLFGAQRAIVTSKDPLAEIKTAMAPAGLTGAQVDACIKDAALHEQVSAMKDAAFNVLQVRGTPIFFINGERLEGAVSYDELAKVLQKHLAK